MTADIATVLDLESSPALTVEGRKNAYHPKMEIHARTSFFGVTTSQMGSWIRQASPQLVLRYITVYHMRILAAHVRYVTNMLLTRDIPVCY